MAGTGYGAGVGPQNSSSFVSLTHPCFSFLPMKAMEKTRTLHLPVVHGSLSLYVATKVLSAHGL